MKNILILLLLSSNCWAALDSQNGKEYKMSQTEQTLNVTGAFTGTTGVFSGSLTASTLTVTGSAFSVGGSTLVVLEGLVGIGASPAGSVAPLALKTNVGNFATSIIENSGTESWQIGVDVDGDLNFNNSAGVTPSIVFNDDGNVGISTTSPVGLLSVMQPAGSAASSYALYVASTTTSGGPMLGVKGNGGIELGGTVVPTINDNYSLGSGAKQWYTGIFGSGGLTSVGGFYASGGSFVSGSATSFLRIGNPANPASGERIYMSSGTAVIDGNVQLAIDLTRGATIKTIRPGTGTKAQLQALAPGAIGEIVFCSDCTVGYSVVYSLYSIAIRHINIINPQPYLYARRRYLD